MDVLEYEGVKVEWLGHASFRIKGSKVIYIDPFLVDKFEKADIVLVTHEHFDHCAKENIARLIEGGVPIIGPRTCVLSFPAAMHYVVKPGDELEVQGVRIRAVHAYNVGKPYHPKGRGVGYLLEIDGVTIYHAGDTDLIPEMEELRDKVDIALLPIGGTYTMGPKEAAKACEIIRPKIVVPMHYGSLKGLEKDASTFVKLVSSCEVVTLEPKCKL